MLILLIARTAYFCHSCVLHRRNVHLELLLGCSLIEWVINSMRISHILLNFKIEKNDFCLPFLCNSSSYVLSAPSLKVDIPS